ncbi:vacuolar protein sorting-associated protein 13D isoform X2 [Drosophila busckii]|uniref:vacuolar protein sorting-associated protein 13D isoform X2 n=1 Tax=Drosophila busckii TaxID=30019 RepID=UPI00143304B4|nr:vacuolar protein sorting-associated protein 13D isoform X2 [Drosophila busckii]
MRMDNFSGSLKQSGTCSPVTPNSPEISDPQRPMTQHIIKNAVHNIQHEATFVTEETNLNALITIEIKLNNLTYLQTSKVSFNSLDIIANQETILELLNFAERTFCGLNVTKGINCKKLNEHISDPKELIRSINHEILFDFYRLNILVLYTIKQDKFNIAKKVCTLTINNAKINVSLHKCLSITGSLGGIQIIDITPQGNHHPEILSIGRDPESGFNRQSVLNKLCHKMYFYDSDAEKCDLIDALSFQNQWNENNDISLNVRMASVCYTHSPRFLKDFNFCITSFERRLREFLTSIGSKATDMAKDFVQQIKDANDDTKPSHQNKYSMISSDIVINSPIIILPISPESKEVLIANLGKICLSNEDNIEESGSIRDDMVEKYTMEVKNINLFSLNMCEHINNMTSTLLATEVTHSNKSDVFPILHNTAISLILHVGYTKSIKNERQFHTFLLEGSMIETLKLTLNKKHYKNIIESIEHATNFSNDISTNNEKLNIKCSRETKLIYSEAHRLDTTIIFSIPVLQINLQNEFHEDLVNVTFKDFFIKYHLKGCDTDLKIILNSVLLEDLKTEVISPFRNMVTSINVDKSHKKKGQLSTSCPNLPSCCNADKITYTSVPSNLCEYFNLKVHYREPNTVLPYLNEIISGDCPNLVIYKSRSNRSINEQNTIQIVKEHSLEFNCLSLIICVDRWCSIFDFFGLTSEGKMYENPLGKKNFTTSESLYEHSNKFNVSIRSLNFTLTRNALALAKMNISNATFTITHESAFKAVEGCLGSIAVHDLTKFGILYKERFVTDGTEALNFVYKRKLNEVDTQSNISTDAVLWINMSSVHYIHTKRFIVELHLFVKDLLQLQSPVINKLKKRKSDNDQNSQPSKVKLCIKAGSPVIVLPVCFNSKHVLIAYLGQLTLKNSFHFAKDKYMDNDEIFPSQEEILDVMHINLVNINLFSGKRVMKIVEKELHKNIANNSYLKGNQIFKESCHLYLQVERNLTTSYKRVCPDISIKGTFSKLNATLTAQNYKLIKGLINNNIGEHIEDVNSSFYNQRLPSFGTFSALNLFAKNEDIKSVTTLISIRILLEDVSILLVLNTNTVPDFVLEPLACVHFIRSQLQIDMFNDGTHDIDLISSNILIVDERPNNSKHINNVFKNILQPSKKDKLPKHSAQVEIHCRKRSNISKYTIMLNDMRIIAVLNFMERFKMFLEDDYFATCNKTSSQTLQTDNLQSSDSSVQEFIINITDSEVIFVEQCNQLDSNAIILKSTTVISYKPHSITSPLSVNINHLEIFSCILDSEEDSALSIIDPFTLNIEMKNNCLNIVIQKQLNIRLSYIDMKIFLKMVSLIPKQSSSSQNILTKSNSEFEKIAPLVAMGFDIKSCLDAMEVNNWKLNEAALWLSQQKHSTVQNSVLELKTVILDANVISLCVIDDCMDADVPLLEILLSKTQFKYKFQVNMLQTSESSDKFSEGDLDTEMAVNFYNRRLSGWEPLAELWQCSAKWKYRLTKLDKGNIDVNISSKQLLKINITSTFIELFNIVLKNWTNDFYNHTLTDSMKTTNFRQRTPFIPFALQNLTGSAMLFKPIYAQLGDLTCSDFHQQEIIKNWISVQPNEKKTFDFSQKRKLRHNDSHLLNIHQILVQIHGWSLIGPISIDKVGKYFRTTISDTNYEKKRQIVFDISLMGSAQKLINVMSPLKVINKLEHKMFLRMVSNSNESDTVTTITDISPYKEQCVPLKYVDSLLYISHILPESKMKKNSIYMEKTELGIEEINWKQYVNDFHQRLHISYDIDKTVLYTLININRDIYPSKEQNVPGHSIVLLPPLMLSNMLCCELTFNINGSNSGRVNAFENKNIYNINIYEPINLSITLDNFHVSGQLKVPTNHVGLVEPKLKLIDINNRELHLHVSIQSFKGKGIEIYVSAPVWIVNKTGLPLIYKQEGTNNISAGQFDEHETARQVSPLMFSFSDQEGSPSLEVRLGNSFGFKNQWCKSFSMVKSTTFRELRTENGPGSYTIGISVRRGKGIYSCTTFVTLSPRFHLYNKTGSRLEFAQKCDVQNHDITSSRSVITAPVNCNFPFHWTNWDREPLLCIRLPDVECCCWSKGIPINESQSLYINIRNEWCEMFFLRLEIIFRDATFMLLFTDARSLPPPIRIDNFSEVPINFSQMGSKPIWSTPVRAQSSLSYVLDDPLGIHSLLIEAPGGNLIECPINIPKSLQMLTYSNFIYIAFIDTFAQHEDNEGNNENQYEQLVLGVCNKQVVIMEKNFGDRSQLWLMNSNGQLEHEGSTPPIQSNEANTVRLVLDLEKPPNPSELTALVVRTPNKQRITTQTWRFENGRLMCHANMCVQAFNGKHGLCPNSQAVLGRVKYNFGDGTSTPIEQHLIPQKLRPGSGQLEICANMDGPICTVQVKDIKINMKEVHLAPDLMWTHASFTNRQMSENGKNQATLDYMISVDLPKGVGISLITLKPCEEIIYITLDNISTTFMETYSEKSVDVHISYIQVDNQLLDSINQVSFHSSTTNDTNINAKALVLKMKLLPTPNKNALIFKYLTLDIKPCIMYLEEKLILKMAFFLGYGKDHQVTSFMPYEDVEEFTLEKDMKRYYFEHLSIGPTQVRLSAYTTSKLPDDLQAIKKVLGLTLIKFEDALIEFDQFSDKYHFETIDVYLRTMKIHYLNQIKWHAASILGSVDFLGNPLGFANDLSEGVSGLIFEGSVKSLVKNVAHGISNSTAKLTETLSDSLGKVILDDHDNETRQRILELQSNTSSGHLAAGIKGFGFGLLGGVTSIVRHTYDGAQSDGVHGLLRGLGLGLVGTVTKPIIGMLDLASEAASAVRETSKDSHRTSPNRKRLPRCVTSASGGLLPSYSSRQSKGQQYLYLINRRNFLEKIIFYEPNLWSDKEARLRLLVSTEYVRIFSLFEENPTVMFECHLSEILSCHPLTTNVGSNTFSISYFEISTNLTKITRPRVRCRTEECAESVSRCINYAKSVFDERELTLTKYF